MLKFNPKTGISINEISEVREQVRKEWERAFIGDGKPKLNTESETPAGQLIDSQTASIVNKDNELLFLAQQFNPLKASGIWQEALGAIYFLKRKPSIKSTALIKCSGLYNTVIPKGALIKSIIDNTSWVCTKEDYIRSNGYVEIEFQCQEEGPITAQPKTLSNIITTVPGWDMAINENQAIIGQYEESQASFEDRRFNSVALNSRSSAESVYSRVASLNGVIAVSIAQNRSNKPITIDNIELKPHSVYLCVLGGNKEEIAHAMYATVSAGCDYNGSEEVEIIDPYTKAKDLIKFDRPIDKKIKIKVNIIQDKSTYPNVEDLAKDCVYDNFYGNSEPVIRDKPVLRITMGQEIYASRFITALLASNIKQVASVKLIYPDTSEEEKDMIKIPMNINPTLDKEDIIIGLIPSEG